MKTPQQEAHLRMLETLPRKTHVAHVKERIGYKKPSGKFSVVSPEVFTEMLRLDKLNPPLKRSEIARQCGVSSATVYNHLGPRRK